MKKIEGSVTAPKGFRASGVTAHIKNLASTKKDCALIVSDAPAVVAGTFTTNRVKAAPVLWCQEVCARGRARAVFANSGNANACTGTRGLEDARITAEKVAQCLGISAQEVCVLSTGVIGVPLPMDRIEKGIDACAAALSPDGGADAARAIMTTDTVPKERAVEIPLAGANVRIGAIAKGAGMIAPNMATLLCVITTDAAMEAGTLQPLLRRCVEVSFNRICVDNDMSTNDTVLCLANGQAGAAPLTPGSDGYTIFAEAFEHICVDIAKALVRDGEGAGKFVEIRVEGAPNAAAAKTIAETIAKSQLCKTAFAGSDPNWGRIGCAAGYSGVPFDANDLCIWLEGLEVVHNGLPSAYEEADAAARMQQREFTIRVSVGSGHGICTFWTCDLSHDYVTINADYRT